MRLSRVHAINAHLHFLSTSELQGHINRTNLGNEIINMEVQQILVLLLQVLL